MNNIKKLIEQKPTFVFIMGATGSGKNYIVKKLFSGVDLVDIDYYMKKIANETGKDERKVIGKAVAYANKELEKHFKSDKSVIQVGTGGNLKGTLNKFIKAKSFNFKTVLILVKTDIKTAQKRNIDRAEKGDQRLVPNWKVEKSYNASLENFEILKNSPNVDFFEIIKN